MLTLTSARVSVLAVVCAVAVAWPAKASPAVRNTIVVVLFIELLARVRNRKKGAAAD
jgi:hypothetical protein